MKYLTGTIVLFLLPALSSPALAQQPARHSSRTAVWTVVGAGAGFGIGLWAGLAAFDDAINSDRKVWTSAIAGAAAGGTLAYLLARGRRSSSPSRSGSRAGPAAAPRLQPSRLDEADIRLRAASTRLRP